MQYQKRIAWDLNSAFSFFLPRLTRGGFHQEKQNAKKFEFHDVEGFRGVISHLKQATLFLRTKLYLLYPMIF
jgi:hypothetical protein